MVLLDVMVGRFGGPAVGAGLVFVMCELHHTVHAGYLSRVNESRAIPLGGQPRSTADD
jgi:hypothetical protein